MAKLLKRIAALFVLMLCTLMLSAQSWPNINCGLLYDSYHWQPGYGITMIMHGGTPIYTDGFGYDAAGWFVVMQGIRTNWHSYAEIGDTDSHGWINPGYQHWQCYIN